MKAKDLIRALRKVGVKILRSKGSHHFLAHDDGRNTVVPVQTGETIGTGLLVRILRDVKLTRDQLLKLLECNGATQGRFGIRRLAPRQNDFASRSIEPELANL